MSNITAPTGTFSVTHAYFGATDNNGHSCWADVSGTLQAILNKQANGQPTPTNSSVCINTGNFNDPLPGYPKSFTAQVVVNGATCRYVCAENETINFYLCPVAGNPQYTVNWAFWGASWGVQPGQSYSLDITNALQNLLNTGSTVTFNSQNFGDPTVGFTKGFVGSVTVNGNAYKFAGAENSTINFSAVPN